MARELPRLLKSYEFLKSARREHGSHLSASDARGLENSLDRAFLEILMYASEDPRVTLAQARFLVSSLAELTADAVKGDALKQACRRHLDRLEAQVSPPSVCPPKPASLEYRYLESLRDRVAVVDADYRYVYTNKANADFHGVSAASFVGRPNWTVVGMTYFEKRNKPWMDAGFAGRPDSFIARHPLAHPSVVHAVNVDPVLDDCGRVTSVLVTCRNVSNLPIPAELIIPVA